MSLLKKPKTKKLAIQSPTFDLARMLETKRPAGSKSVEWFNDKWLSPLGGYYDGYGNYIVRIGVSRVLWSSHTDTVHNSGGFQKVVLNNDLFKVASNEKSNCLGADCTTGVWLMREMILSGVRGLYVFHDSEEIGGLGSEWIVKNTPDLLDGIDFAIAFDRRGYDSIITHQYGGRCASDDFARSIAPLLPNGYKIDTGGTFTDTANYTTLISECTNLSVGYEGAHTSKETQSLSHAMRLRQALLAFDETKLIKARIAGSADRDEWPNDYKGASRKSYGSFDYLDYYDLAEYVEANPYIVADFLENYGVSLKDLLDYAK
jgi:hypothetical protein